MNFCNLLCEKKDSLSMLSIRYIVSQYNIIFNKETIDDFCQV